MKLLIVSISVNLTRRVDMDVVLIVMMFGGVMWYAYRLDKETYR